MKLVQFNDIYGKEVWINPDQVCTVWEFTKDSCYVGFGSDEGRVTIKQAAGLVARTLFNAGRQ